MGKDNQFHLFIRYIPPALPGVSEEAILKYQSVINNVYIYGIFEQREGNNQIINPSVFTEKNYKKVMPIYKNIKTLKSGKIKQLMENIFESLKDKGPKYASDSKYKSCQIEDTSKWKVPDSVVAPFGNKYYLLTSNKKDQTMPMGAISRE